MQQIRRGRSITDESNIMKCSMKNDDIMSVATQPSSPCNISVNGKDNNTLRRSSSFLDGFGASIGRYLEFGMARPPPSGIYRHLYAREMEQSTNIINQFATEQFPNVASSLGSYSQSVETKNNAYEQAQLLLVSLLENFCALYDRNPDKNRRLFIALCKQLWNMGILTSADFFNRSEELRGVYKEAFRTLVLQAIQGIEADTETEVKLLTDDGEYSDAPNSGSEDGQLELETDFGGAFEANPVSSRLENEFKDLEVIARGGFAQVFQGEHRIDHCLYAFKRIEFKSKSSESYEKIIREIKSLAHLDHPYIVRYHGAWIEEKTFASLTLKHRESRDNFSHSQTDLTPSTSSIGISVPIGNSAREFEVEPCNGYFMIIQMELCQFTLADWIEQRNFLIRYGKTWKPEYSPRHSRLRMCIPSDRMATLIGDQIWDINPIENCRIFKCIVKALQHIHSKGIIHRDLKPGNILFQVDEDLYIPKIGDFGLASDISLSPAESLTSYNSSPSVPSLSPTNNNHSDWPCSDSVSPGFSPSVSRSTRTTGLGTCMYAAPEQIRDSDYNEKVDIYSLGIILFELFHPFATRMERQDVLEDLKNGIIPASFVKRWPKEATLIWSCICPNSEPRPSAEQILESEILEQDPDDTIERLAKENSTLKKLLEAERERVRMLELNLVRVNQLSDRPGKAIEENLCHMKINH